MTIAELPIHTADIARWDESTDVLVAGLGIAGLAAALEAHRAGADVLVVERASGGGGASATSEGIFYLGGGTALQKALGYDETPENMYNFMRASTTTPDDVKLRVFCEHSAEHFDWLEAQGVPFERRAFTGKAVAVDTGEGLMSTGNEKVWPFRELAEPRLRGHQTQALPGTRGGIYALKALLETYERERVPTWYDSRVTALVIDGAGRVCGAKVRSEGTDRLVRARRGVILATGSFNLNQELTAQNLPVLTRTASKPLGIDTNDGAGVLLGRSVGAATQGMDGAIATASIYPPAQLIKGIVVNSRGQRFVAEDSYHGRLAHAIELQPDQVAYLIVDEEIFAYPVKGSHKLVDGWETIAEMEVGLGVPAGSLQRTLDEFNADAAAGEDRVFHKHPDWLRPLSAGPYAAFSLSMETSDYHYMSLGGLRADEHGRALDDTGAVVAGLYAVGACSAHFPQNGGEYASGMSLGPGSFFGRRAGLHAAGEQG
jgi:3-oxo-5alpha-steroid 4-dehydrogenase